jgi:hypothetical protein
MGKYSLPALFIVAMLLASVPAKAQSDLLDLPRDSQRAEVSQRIGITNITIRYHRPLVKAEYLAASRLTAKYGGPEPMRTPSSISAMQLRWNESPSRKAFTVCT